MCITKVLTRCEGEFTASTPKPASANAHQSAAIPNHAYKLCPMRMVWVHKIALFCSIFQRYLYLHNQLHVTVQNV